MLSNFLIGEGKLEQYLEQYPPIEANIHRAKLGLIESKKYLQLAANESGRKVYISIFFSYSSNGCDFRQALRSMRIYY